MLGLCTIIAILMLGEGTLGQEALYEGRLSVGASNKERCFVLKEVACGAQHLTDEKLRNRTFCGCAEALWTTHKSGVFKVRLDSYGPTPFDVYCDAESDGGGWTVIQRRQDGSVDFYRDWNAYKTGFGDLHGEFFIGFDKLYAMTSHAPHELLIEMENFLGHVKHAKYDDFAVGNESEDFALKVLGTYSGTAGDGLRSGHGMKFTTFDRDNDKRKTENCAEIEHGAWWYTFCGDSSLNGLYNNDAREWNYQNIYWWYFSASCYPLKRVQMSIRPKLL